MDRDQGALNLNLKRLLDEAAPNRFKRVQTGHGHVFEADDGESGRVRSFLDGHEIVMTIEIALSVGAPLLAQATSSHGALVIQGCLTAQLQPQRIEATYLSDSGYVRAVLLSTRLCIDHARSQQISDRLGTMQDIAGKLRRALARAVRVQALSIWLAPTQGRAN